MQMKISIGKFPFKSFSLEKNYLNINKEFEFNYTNKHFPLSLYQNKSLRIYCAKKKKLLLCASVNVLPAFSLRPHFLLNI